MKSVLSIQIKQTQTMNNLTEFKVILPSKNLNGQIGNYASISTLHLNLNGNLIQYHI